MSNDKVDATFHPDDKPKPKPTEHFDPEHAPIPHAHMDEH